MMKANRHTSGFFFFGICFRWHLIFYFMFLTLKQILNYTTFIMFGFCRFGKWIAWIVAICLYSMVLNTYKWNTFYDFGNMTMKYKSTIQVVTISVFSFSFFVYILSSGGFFGELNSCPLRVCFYGFFRFFLSSLSLTRHVLCPLLLFRSSLAIFLWHQFDAHISVAVVNIVNMFKCRSWSSSNKRNSNKSISYTRR